MKVLSGLNRSLQHALAQPGVVALKIRRKSVGSMNGLGLSGQKLASSPGFLLILVATLRDPLEAIAPPSIA